MSYLVTLPEGFTSRRAFSKMLLVKQSEMADASKEGWWVWSNRHMDPTPPEERTWDWWNYAALWWAYGFSTGVWTLGSSMISAGLTWRQAIICVFIAHLLGAIGIVFNSRGAAVYHVGYPVFQRISFGMFGAFFPILLRCAVGIVWTGVQVYQGGVFTAVILRCIFGHHFTDIPNGIPVASGITTQTFLGVFLFWLITMPLLFMKIHKTRYLWTIKAFVLPPAVIGLFIFTQVANGAGNPNNFSGSKHYGGSTLTWAMLSVINSAMGKTSPSMVNQPDLARYAKTRSAPLWSQLIALPVANTAVACLGIFATSAVAEMWGKTYWNPWDLCGAILDHHWSSGVRFAVLLVSLAFTLSIFVSNQAANVIPFGADISALTPRYVDINRGQFLAYCLGMCICPWYILASATTFLTFLGGYSIFLGPIVGVSVADYFWRHGNLHIPSMYTGSSQSQYWYNKGVNWRACAAFLVGAIPPIPGFSASFGQDVPVGAKHLFQIGWVYSIVSSAVVYVVLCALVPESGMQRARQDTFEKWADDQKDLLDGTMLPTSSDAEKYLDEKRSDIDSSVSVMVSTV